MPVLLGVDWGEKRIGLAVTDEAGMMALPLKTVEVRGRKHFLQELEKVFLEHRIQKIIVGLPVTLKGESGPAAEKVTTEVEWYRRHTDIPWILWDERLSSREVDRVLDEAEMRGRKRRAVRDQLAAQRILQSYMDVNPV